MSDTWTKECCAKCKSINWICLGDLSDITGEDFRGFKCFKCGEEQKYNDCDLGEEDLEGLDYANGLEKPT